MSATVRSQSLVPLGSRVSAWGQRCLGALVVCLLTCWVLCGGRARGADEEPVPVGLQIATEVGAACLTAPEKPGLRVLILSDSMGLGGFSAELDACFRACPGVAAVHTIVAGGTNPLSWLKQPPYSTISTRSGYWSIQSVPGKSAPKQEKDVHGMTKGHKPSAHRVPKIEDLLEQIKPEIVVFQNGNNFFDFFKQGKEIKAEVHTKQIRGYVLPLLRWLAANGSSVKKFYWVSPAEAGNVTPEVQQFVFDCIANEVAKIGVMLDSRKVTHFPYKLQQPDKMHFWGKEALDWGDAVFRMIAEDLVANDLSKAEVLVKRAIDFDPPPPVVNPGDIVVRARLKAVTKVPEPAAFAPYGEYMVGYLYEVLKVATGTYEEKELLVMHPAYIKHTKLDLSRFVQGKEMYLVVSEITEASLWAAVHRRDDVGTPELFPYMLSEDVPRHPDFTKRADAKP